MTRTRAGVLALLLAATTQPLANAESIPEILNILFDATNGDNWHDYDGWYSPNPFSFCDWSGITCYDVDRDDERYGHIETLDLSANRLEGDLPVEIWDIPYLHNLVLRENPDLVINFDGIEYAEHLHRLVLSNTYIDSFEYLSSESLNELHLTDCSLNGVFPYEVTQLVNLEALYANFNRLNGNIPDEIGDMENLVELYLYDNYFEGPIPDTIGNLQYLEALVLSNNDLTGELPADQLNKLVSLRVITLSGNWFKGEIPSLDNLSELRELFLFDNDFTGQIPKAFLWSAPKDELITVDLRNNHLTGEFASRRMNDFYKMNLFVTGNQFDGLDPDLCENTQWLGGEVGKFNCEAIMCPIGSWAPEGRRTANDECVDGCVSALWMGMTNCDDRTLRILSDFYDAMDGDSWKENNWFDAEDECEWTGITCDNNRHITALELPMNKLSGTPPASLFELQYLEVLDLSNNFIRFKFDGIDRAENLMVLNLSSTGLDSLMFIDQLVATQITELYLSSNKIEDIIPDAIYDLRMTLEVLDIAHNKFYGGISTDIQYLIKLRKFIVYGNKLTGKLPDEFVELAATLTEVVLSENDFTGEIPAAFSNMPSLEILSIHQKTNTKGGLTGEVPDFSGSPKLWSVNLASNSLSSYLPETFMENSVLVGKFINVDLRNNDIRGRIPPSWDMFGYLNINLANNLISSMPSVLCEMKGWQNGVVGAIDNACDAILCEKGSFNAQGRATLDFECVPCPDAEYYGATVCDSLGLEEVWWILEIFYASTFGEDWTIGDHGWLQGPNYCDGTWAGITCDNDKVHIIGIDLSDSGLRGTPDPMIFNLPRLEELDLEGNDIDFDFSGIATAKALRVLYLSDTQVSSLQGIGAATSLTELHLTGNYLSDQIPDELFDLTNLRFLYMNYNAFTGRLSSKIGQLENLEELFMMSNDLTGQLPASIGYLTKLKILALSENNFVGAIPESINNMKDLEILALQGEGSRFVDNFGVNRKRKLKQQPRKMSEQTPAGLTGALPSFDGLVKLQGLYLGFNSLQGQIPYNFLAGIADKTKTITIELESNYLSGVVPASLTQFDALDLFLGGNKFSEIAPGLCSMTKWLDGDVGSYDCDAIICPMNTFSQWGRHDSDSSCEPCPDDTVSPYLGSLECVSAAFQAIEDEKTALKSIYDSLDGIGWYSQGNWYDDATSFCEWHGITCTSEGESVQSIHLPNNGLSGIVPSSVFDLPNLVELNLGGNDITINFDNIGSADNLEYLNLDSTGLTSLSGIQNAPSLVLLHASTNSLTVFPQEVLSLTGLQSLYLSYNKFEIEMPNLSVLTELAFFVCKRCGFKGTVPSWLGDLVGLQYLSLAGNKLTGAIPSFLAEMNSLEHLDLSDQAPRGGGLTGGIPSFGTSENLSELYLSRNKLSGSIPEDFLALTTAGYVMVDLRENAITGSIPTDLNGAFDDFVLLLAGNKIDTIPDSLCNPPPEEWNDSDLVEFGCDGLLCEKGFYSSIGRATNGYECEKCDDDSDTDTQQFFGSTTCGTSNEMQALEAIYKALGGPDWNNNVGWMENDKFCTWPGIECDYDDLIIGIDFTANNLVGEVPEEIYELTSLTYLILNENIITIDFDGIEKLSALETLKLSDMGLTSIAGIGGASSLKELHLTNNELTTIPNEFYNLVNLERLYMNYNKVEGQLSSKIGQLVALEELFMFRNKLSGSLPAQIADLKNIKILAIGENDFSGELPVRLNDLQNIEIIALQHVSNNGAVAGSPVNASGFTGSVPAFDNNPKLREVYLSYNSLTGRIPSSFLRGIDDKSAEVLVDLTGNEITGSFPSTLNPFGSLRIYVADNKISELDQSFCDYSNWMDGEVESGGCDAIMCPPGTSNEFGRQTNEGPNCEPCPFTFTAPYFGSTSCSPDATDYNEREILTKFYEAVGGSKWLDADNWLEDKVSICEWHGVFCETKDGNVVVTEIRLPSNKMAGTVPPQIFNLEFLKMLNIRDNKVDVELHAMRESPALRELYLDFTSLSSIKGVGKATNLHTLHVQENNLRGESIPDELFDLTGLKHLFMSDSNIGGRLHNRIGNLWRLEDFYCHGNDLTGVLPGAIGDLENLEVLVLSENMFVGPIPDSFANLSSLQSLFIDSFTRKSAGLSGPLPSFEGMPNLRQIYLNENSLTGTIPENFLSNAELLQDDYLNQDALTALARRKQKISVGLKGNRIQGAIPASLTTFQKLDIDLSDNMITSIDDAICDMDAWMGSDVGSYGCKAVLCPAGFYSRYGRQSNDLSPCKQCAGAEQSVFLGATMCMSEIKKKEREILELFYKKCGGDKWKNNDKWLDDNTDICDWYGIDCSNGGSVDSILLGSNNLIGTPPSQIFELENLKFLWLYSNPIKFSFSGIGEARHITSLLLDSTGLESLEGIGQAYQLTDLDVRFNKLSGPIPDEVTFLANLETLSMSDNDLTGALPSFSHMHRLKSLRLSNNRIAGFLPSFAANYRLKTLDLSDNKISGKIPTAFLDSVDTDETIYIDLSRNRIEGNVPRELARFDQMTIYLKDNYLFGIESDICDNDAWNDGDVGSYGCDAVLCPPGTYSPGNGRQSLGGSGCMDCEDAKFYGQSQCVDLQKFYSSAVSRGVGMALVLVVAGVTMLLV